MLIQTHGVSGGGGDLTSVEHLFSMTPPATLKSPVGTTVTSSGESLMSFPPSVMPMRIRKNDLRSDTMRTRY